MQGPDNGGDLSFEEGIKDRLPSNHYRQELSFTTPLQLEAI